MSTTHAFLAGSRYNNWQANAKLFKRAQYVGTEMFIIKLSETLGTFDYALGYVIEALVTPTGEPALFHRHSIRRWQI